MASDQIEQFRQHFIESLEALREGYSGRKLSESGERSAYVLFESLVTTRDTAPEDEESCHDYAQRLAYKIDSISKVSTKYRDQTQGVARAITEAISKSYSATTGEAL